MYYIRKISLPCFVALAGLFTLLTQAYPQCSSDFVYQTDSVFNVQFIDSSKSIDTIPFSGRWSWQIGDLETSTLQNPFFRFPDTGTFDVCLKITSLDSMCIDSICKTIEIKRPACNAKFSYQAENVYTVHFHDSSSENITYRRWDFGDWVYSEETNPTHRYQDKAKYVVRLFVANEDSTCTDTYSDTIIILDTTSCHANFSYIQHNDTTFQFIQSSNGPFDSITWDFGDGETSTGDSIIHVYGEPGNYQVCLFVINSLDTAYCNDSLCQNIVIEEYINLSGHVYAGNKYLEAGKIHLYAVAEGGLFLTDSTDVTGGHFSINIKNDGQYILKCIPVEEYGFYSPTYYPEVLLAESAHVFTLDKNTGGIDLYLLEQAENTINSSAYNHTFHIFPNPAGDNVSINFPSGSINLELFNIQGEKMITRSLHGKKNILLNLENIKTGIYFVRIQTTDKVISKKLLVK